MALFRYYFVALSASQKEVKNEMSIAGSQDSFYLPCMSVYSYPSIPSSLSIHRQAGAAEVATIQVKLDAALTELSQVQEARQKEADASTKAASVAEAKIQAIEEREAAQINKARQHCEELAVSLQETEGSLETAEARVGELTSKLKESQNARLDLQV